jgi:hypothetical protein
VETNAAMGSETGVGVGVETNAPVGSETGVGVEGLLTASATGTRSIRKGRNQMC